MLNRMDWSRFQILALTLAATLVAIRAMLLWFNMRVNPFRATHPVEICFALGELLFASLILRNARFVNLPVPAWADMIIVSSETARGVGGFFVAAGIVIFALALFSFGNSWRIGIDRRTPGALVTTGVFRISRNPIFVFLDLYLGGTFLLNGTLVFLAVAVLGAAVLHLQILREERFLQAHYGESYRKYCERTPRYLIPQDTV